MPPSPDAPPDAVKLYLLRHAQADARIDGQDHPDRALTAKGLRQASAVGRFAQTHALPCDLALTSPYRRARDTLAQVAAAWPPKAPVCAADWLRIETPTDAWLAGLARLRLQHQGLGSLLLVGHEPDLSLAMAALLGSHRPDAVKMRKGALACLDLSTCATTSPGAAQLQWLVTPDLLPG